MATKGKSILEHIKINSLPSVIAREQRDRGNLIIATSFLEIASLCSQRQGGHSLKKYKHFLCKKYALTFHD